ncbi:MAG: flagellar hook-associated protein FlgK [Bacteroidota bacterium]
MSLFQLFEIGRRSLGAYDAAINVTGQNIANAENENYSRQRVTFGSDGISIFGNRYPTPNREALGLGVSVDRYERVRDGLLLQSSWDAQADLGSAEEEYRISTALEGLLPASGTGSLGDLLNNFWGAWNNLADNPTDLGARSAVLSRTEELASTLNRLDADLSLQAEETERTLTEGVGQVNRLLDRLGTLNGQIAASRAAGTPDFAAEDERDALVNELSSYGPVQVAQDEATGYAVKLNGMTVVQGETVLPLTLDTSGTVPTIGFSGTSVEYQARPPSDGSLGAWLRTLQDTIPALRSGLDQIAQALVTNVNAAQSSGYGLDGSTGNNLFDQAGTSASSIRLSTDVSDPRAVAASAAPNTPGDSSIALSIAALRESDLVGGGTQTIDNLAIELSTDLGVRASQAQARATAATSLNDYLTGLERGVSGVDIDEELTNLIKYQQSYAAAARVINTAQEMTDTILAL